MSGCEPLWRGNTDRFRIVSAPCFRSGGRACCSADVTSTAAASSCMHVRDNDVIVHTVLMPIPDESAPHTDAGS